MWLVVLDMINQANFYASQNLGIFNKLLNRKINEAT